MELEKPQVVTSAIWALGEINSPKSAKPIWQSLETTEDLRVREAAQSALAKMKFNPETINSKLESESVLVRQSAVEQASKSGHPDAQKILLKALSDDNDKVQNASVRGLSVTKVSNLVQPIEEAYEKGSTRVKVNLIRALGKAENIDTPWITDKLISASQSKSSQVRIAAIDALGKLKNDQTLEALIQASRDESYAVKGAAVAAMGNYDSAVAQKRLQEIVKDTQAKSLQKAALKSIDKQKRLRRSETYKK